MQIHETGLPDLILHMFVENEEILVTHSMSDAQYSEALYQVFRTRIIPKRQHSM